MLFLRRVCIALLWVVVSNEAAAAARPAVDRQTLSLLNSRDALVVAGLLHELSTVESKSIPRRAVPKLLKIAAGKMPVKVRRDALLLVIEIGERAGPQAHKMLARIARSKTDRQDTLAVNGLAAIALGATKAPVRRYGLLLLELMAPRLGIAGPARDGFAGLSGKTGAFARRALRLAKHKGIRNDLAAILAAIPVDRGGYSTAEVLEAAKVPANYNYGFWQAAVQKLATSDTPADDLLVLLHAQPDARYAVVDTLIELKGRATPAVAALCKRLEKTPDDRLLLKFFTKSNAGDGRCAAAALIKAKALSSDGVKLLIKLPGGPEHFTALAQSGPPEARARAMDALTEAGHRSAAVRKAAQHGARTKDVSVRQSAARLLGLFGETERASLLPLFDDPSDEVQLAAVQSSSGAWARAALKERIKRSKKKKSAELTRLFAIQASEENAQFIVELDFEPWAEARLLSSLEPLPLETMMFAEDSDVRKAAAASIPYHLRAEAGIPALLTLLDDDTASVRIEAASSLGRYTKTTPRAVTALIQKLEDPDSVVRRITVRTLGVWGEQSKAALPKIRALYDHWELGEAAITSAVHIAPDRSLLPRVIALLDKATAANHVERLELLWKIAPKHPRIPKELKARIADKDYCRRDAAIALLAKAGSRKDKLRASALKDRSGFIRLGPDCKN